jgi:hypothetical protein
MFAVELWLQRGLQARPLPPDIATRISIVKSPPAITNNPPIKPVPGALVS